MEESELIAAAQDGDREAFNELVLQYQSLVYNVAYRILSDPDRAADAAQDAFISAYKGIGRFRGGSFKGWLMRIVTNACYDQLRVKKRRPTAPLEAVLYSEPAEDAMLAGHPTQPQQYMEQQELGKLIQQALDTLPDAQRAVVVLADIQDFQYDEIAVALGISLGTVKSRLSRGRRKLRDFLRSNAELLPSRYRLHSNRGGVAGVANLFAEGDAAIIVAWLWGSKEK